MYTEKEINDFLEEHKYSKEITIMKEIIPQFKFENFGKTIANNVKISIDMRQKDAEWINIHPDKIPFKLFPSAHKYIKEPIYIPIATNIPDSIFYSIKIEYEDSENNKHQREINYYWLKLDNDFRRYADTLYF